MAKDVVGAGCTRSLLKTLRLYVVAVTSASFNSAVTPFPVHGSFSTSQLPWIYAWLMHGIVPVRLKTRNLRERERETERENCLSGISNFKNDSCPNPC